MSFLWLEHCYFVLFMNSLAEEVESLVEEMGEAVVAAAAGKL